MNGLSHCLALSSVQFSLVWSLKLLGLLTLALSLSLYSEFVYLYFICCSFCLASQHTHTVRLCMDMVCAC